MNKHLLRQALDSVGAPLLICDPRAAGCVIVHASPASDSLTGVPATKVIGQPLSRFAGAFAGEAFDPASVTHLYHHDGTQVAVSLHPLYEHPGRVSLWLLVRDEVAGVRQERAAAAATTGVFSATGTWRLAGDDPRAEFFNPGTGRAAMEKILCRDWAQARRDRQRLNVVVFRVDEIEAYREVFGRHAAEACLRKIGHVINNALRRAADYCARIGTDRFAILVQGSDESKVVAFAGRIAGRVRDLAIHHPRSSTGRYVGVSFAVASAVPGDGDCELLETAELDLEGRELPPAVSDLPAVEH